MDSVGNAQDTSHLSCKPINHAFPGFKELAISVIDFPATGMTVIVWGFPFSGHDVKDGLLFDGPAKQVIPNPRTWAVLNTDEVLTLGADGDFWFLFAHFFLLSFGFI